MNHQSRHKRAFPTGRAIAQELGVTQQRVSKWFLGDVPVPPRYIDPLLRLLTGGAVKRPFPLPFEHVQRPRQRRRWTCLRCGQDKPEQANECRACSKTTHGYQGGESRPCPSCGSPMHRRAKRCRPCYDRLLASRRACALCGEPRERLRAPMCTACRYALRDDAAQERESRSLHPATRAA